MLTFLRSMLLGLCMLTVNMPAFAQTFGQKLGAGTSVNALVVADSLGGGGVSYFPYRFAARIASDYPSYRVVLKVRTNGSMTTNDTVIQAGGSGAPLANVYVDGISGATSFRADQRATIYSASGLAGGTLDLAIVALGINDSAQWFGHWLYTQANYMTNLRALGDYPKQTFGAEVIFVTPFWNESHFWSGTASSKVALAAATMRAVARENNRAKIADARVIFEDHGLLVDAAGNAGQGDWFPTSGDYAHPGQVPHYLVGDEIFAVATQ